MLQAKIEAELLSNRVDGRSSEPSPRSDKGRRSSLRQMRQNRRGRSYTTSALYGGRVGNLAYFLKLSNAEFPKLTIEGRIPVAPESVLNSKVGIEQKIGKDTTELIQKFSSLIAPYDAVVLDVKVVIEQPSASQTTDPTSSAPDNSVPRMYTETIRIETGTETRTRVMKQQKRCLPAISTMISNFTKHVGEKLKRKSEDKTHNLDRHMACRRQSSGTYSEFRTPWGTVTTKVGAVK